MPTEPIPYSISTKQPKDTEVLQATFEEELFQEFPRPPDVISRTFMLSHFQGLSRA